MNSLSFKIFSFLSLLIFNSLFSIDVNVMHYGAKGNGIIDDTFAFQECADLLASKGGGNLVIPQGNYLIRKINFIGKKYSNINLIGNNANIIEKIATNRRSLGRFQTYAQKSAADGIFVFEANVSYQKNDTESIKNISISGLNFISDVEKYGFDELSHQISAHGVSNFKIKNCNFKGFLGDGIAINRGTHETGARNAYNKNIIIENCVFDGVNNNNRNGISIYYSDGFIITDCDFENITRPDMIGAIDIEADDTFNISRNGIIRNCNFKNIGGLAAIAFFQKSANNYKNLLIENCVIDGATTPLYVLGNDNFQNNPFEEDIIMRNCNVKNTAVAAIIIKGYNIFFENVKFENITSSVANVVPEGGASNITFSNCTFKNTINPAGIGFTGVLKNINFIGNTFEDFVAQAITINSPTGIGKIKNNYFKSTKQQQSLPLITHYFGSLSEISESEVSGNISYQNYLPLDLRFFTKETNLKDGF